MNNILSGIFGGFAVWLALFLTMPVPQKEWRQCAPAQDGFEIVATSQYEDHTECVYQPTRKSKNKNTVRKDVI